jgi:hypothetical protein
MIEINYAVRFSPLGTYFISINNGKLLMLFCFLLNCFYMFIWTRQHRSQCTEGERLFKRFDLINEHRTNVLIPCKVHLLLLFQPTCGTRDSNCAYRTWERNLEHSVNNILSSRLREEIDIITRKFCINTKASVSLRLLFIHSSFQSDKGTQVSKNRVTTENYTSSVFCTWLVIFASEKVHQLCLF